MSTNSIQRIGLSFAAAAAAWLGACGGEGSGSSTADASGDTTAPVEVTQSYVFGVIAKSQSNAVFQAARTGAEAAARDLSEQYGVNIRIDWKTPTDEDAQRQAEYMAQLTSAGVDGIAISCTDASILTGVINDSVDSGVAVVTFDSDAPDSRRFANYGIDDVEAGRAIMRHLAQAMGETGIVAVLGGTQTAPNLQARIRGVQEEAKNYPDIEVKYEFYHIETPPAAAAKVKLEQQNKPEISGWAMVGGWPLFTTNALDGIHEVAKVVSVDHLREQLQYVRSGQVQALIGQDCFGWGYQSVVMLFNKVHKGEEPAQVINTFELQVVTADNVEEYEGIWEEWLKDD